MPNSPKNITVTIDDGLNAVPVHAVPGEILLDVLRRSGKPVTAPCGGKGTCGKCSVYIKDVGDTLACQFIVKENSVVTLPSALQFTILDKSHHSKIIENDAGLQVRLENDFKIVSYKNQEIIREAYEDTSNKKFGLAIDVGTTTVVVFLEDLQAFEVVDVASFINPQTAFGGDVISRISYCIENEIGLITLKKSVVDGINKAIAQLCKKNNITPHFIYKTSIVGNTVMLHILLGVNPRSIAFAPYTPVFADEKQLIARDLNLNTHPNCIVTLLPSIAGYVGADIVAGIATTDMLVSDGFILYIDIGTNGEIVLGNRHKIYCCATAAGPAFEGANIECGIGGVTGAISEYEENEFTTIGNGAPIGICGSGLIDIVAALLDKGLIDIMGYMEENFVIARQSACAIDRDIVLTPQDVRQVQLAKSAIYAGIITLMKVAGISFEHIDCLYLAGGFGNYIRINSALRIGLLPRELKNRIMPTGNAAGAGARFALKSIEFEKEIQRVIQKSEYIELSMRQDFNEAYVAAMMFE